MPVLLWPKLKARCKTGCRFQIGMPFTRRAQSVRQPAFFWLIAAGAGGTAAEAAGTGAGIAITTAAITTTAIDTGVAAAVITTTATGTEITTKVISAMDAGIWIGIISGAAAQTPGGMTALSTAGSGTGTGTTDGLNVESLVF